MKFLEFYENHKRLMPGVDHTPGKPAFFALVRDYNTLALAFPEKFTELVQQASIKNRHPAEWPFKVIDNRCGEHGLLTDADVRKLYEESVSDSQPVETEQPIDSLDPIANPAFTESADLQPDSDGPKKRGPKPKHG